MSTHPKRKNIRYSPPVSEYAHIDLNLDGEFKSLFPALVFSESYQGCGLIIRPQKEIIKDVKIRVQVGPMAPIVGRIVWVKELDEDTVKVGVQFDA